MESSGHNFPVRYDWMCRRLREILTRLRLPSQHGRPAGPSKGGRIEISAEPADPNKLPPMLEGFKALPPLVTDIDLSLDDRFL